MTTQRNLARIFLAHLLIALQVGLSCSWANDQSVPKSLLGIPLSFIEIDKRPTFGLNSIVVVPRVENGGRFVLLAIDRRYLKEEFLRDFTVGDSKISRDHP